MTASLDQDALFGAPRASAATTLRTDSVPAMDSQPLTAVERMRRTRARRRGDPDAPPAGRPGPKPRPPEPVRTVAGSNAALIAAAAALYIADGATVADVTYSTGRFWAKTDTSRYTFLPSDLIPSRPGVLAADFRALPYATGSIDTVILDPPYVHNSGTANPHDYAPTTTRYNGHTTAGLYNADIMELYADGMTEAYRVLRPDGGQLWVKCKDEVEREVQRWSHIRIYEIALKLGFCARDLFVLTGATSPQRWPGRIQRHARKNHSFLWVMERPDARYARLLSRPAPSGGVRRRHG